MLNYLLKKIKFILILYIYLFIPLNPLIARESKDFLLINLLVKNCYKDIRSCNKALVKINNYQKNAAINKKFSCQTRLLGLEANLIKVMHFDSKRKEVKNIIDAIKRYC